MEYELPSYLEEPVKELATPVAKEAGTTIGDLWFLALGGISQKANLRRAKYAYELEKYRKELEAELNAVPEEKRIEPNTQVVMNALTDSQSCVEEETLRSMFAKLIASACNEDTASKVHPSFSGIIKQMSPTDAMLLKIFTVKENSPLVNIKMNFLDEPGEFNAYKNVIFPDSSLISLEDQAASVDCLSMHGLVSVATDAHLVDDSKYAPFEEMHEYLQLKQSNTVEFFTGEKRKLEKVYLERGIISLTDFGRRFLHTCM